MAQTISVTTQIGENEESFLRFGNLNTVVCFVKIFYVRKKYRWIKGLCVEHTAQQAFFHLRQVLYGAVDQTCAARTSCIIISTSQKKSVALLTLREVSCASTSQKESSSLHCNSANELQFTPRGGDAITGSHFSVLFLSFPSPSKPLSQNE